MRIRSQKPEFWQDQELAESCSRDARLVYKGLWNMCDEWARTRGDARHVKGALLPYDDDLGPGDVDALIDELVTAGKVVRYFANGGTYLWLPNLHRHQRLEPDRVPSRLPAPPDAGEPALFDVTSHAVQICADEPAPRTDKSAPRVRARSGSREQVAGVGDGAHGRAPGTAPSRYCDKHPNGTDERCGPCGRARERFEAWESQRGVRQGREPPCRIHPGEIASNCRLCAAERKGRT
jgi:hypothetical protein